jgi:hypothetical protein
MSPEDRRRFIGLLDRQPNPAEHQR